MDDTLINNKLADLQQYIPFLTQVINNLKNNNNDKPRPQQLLKMEMLFSLITNKDKKPLKLETLVKCETVVQKIYNKIEKQRDDSSNSSPATVESISTPTKTVTDNPEIIEITEPDSPPIVDQSFHAPPIVIPTERRETPSPTASTSKQHQNNNRDRKMNIWQNSHPEFKRCDDELIDNSFHRRIPTIDRTRNQSNDRLNINFDRTYATNGDHRHENEIYDNRRNNNRNFERNSRLDININKDCFDIPSIQQSYPSERHFEKNERNRYNLMHSGGDFQQQAKYAENHSSFTDHLRNATHDNYHRGNIRHYPEESGFSEWLQNNQIPNNHERYNNREIIDITKNTFDYKHDSRNVRDSPPRSHSRNHNRRDVPERTDRIDRQENTMSPNWDIDDNSPDRLQLGPLTSFDTTAIGGLSRDWGIVNEHSPDRSHLGPLTSFDRSRSNNKKNKKNQNNNLIKIPINLQENLMKTSKSNEQFNDTSKFFDNFPKTLEEPDNSIFNRLGNKIDMTENFQIKVKNERAISKAPLIRDVLKSPPLSAHDIDELYHESGGEVNNNFDVVRKKLAKISMKLKDENLNKSQINSNSSSSLIKSPDPNRLAYKYNPHPRVSLDDPLSPKSSENTLPKSTENNTLKTLNDPRVQKQQKNSTNTLPSVNPNDPRLKIWCSDIVTQIPAASFNSIQNALPSSAAIPSLLDLNIPPVLDLPKPINDILQIKTPIKQIGSVIDKNLNLSLRNSPETSSDSSISYKKFHPLLNDQVERTKYLESKKNKPNTETITKKATTYGEHRRKAEEDNRKDTKMNTDKSKSRDRDIKIIDNKNRDIVKTSNRVESDIKKSGKNLDLIKKQFESPIREPKHHDKTKDHIKRRSDNIGNSGTNNNNRSDGGNKALPNCLDSMYRTSNYKKDLGSVASFKIPKKGKDEDKNKPKEQNSNEQQEIKVVKSNVYETSKTTGQSKLLLKDNTLEKVKNDLSIKQQFTKESLEPSLNSTATIKVSESSKMTENIQELNDNKIQPFNRRQTDEKIKINLIKKNSEILSPSSIELDSDDNWVILSEIGTENTYEDTTENEENNSILSDKESTENKNSKQSKIDKFNTNESVEIEKGESVEVENELEEIMDKKVEEIGTVIPKPLRARRKSVYDIVVSTSDNSVVSTQNIISGKRRNRSSTNLNENLLAISKVQIAAAESAISEQRRSTTPTNNFSNAKSKERKLLKTKNYFKNKKLKNAMEKSSSELLSSPQPTQNVSSELTSPQPSTSNSSSYTTAATGDNCIKKEELSKDSLESFLLDMMNPTKNKSNFLGMLAKVLDENKFQQVKKIIEDDDTDTKNEFNEKKTVELEKNEINKSELSITVPESTDPQAIVKQECIVEKRKQKKKLTELERLNEDIRDMFISKGVITATGRRMCTMMNAVREERDVSSERPLSRQQQQIQSPPAQSKAQSKQISTTKKKNNAIKLAESIQLSNKVPKIVLSKVDISKVNESKVSAGKKRKYSKRRKRFAWSKGIISKKSKKIAGTKKTTEVDNTTSDNIVAPSPTRLTRSLNNSINKMPVLKPITPIKSTGGTRIIRKDKPCPKSKKKFDFPNDEELIQIGDEPILDNSIYIDPSMPILTTISYQKELAELPDSDDLLNVTKLKNIYSGMHAKSEYTNKCVLCKFTGTKVANHYSVNHPDSEVFISRLPPDTLKDLLANKNNHALYSFRKKQQCVYHYRCPFCDIQQSFSRKSWIDHFSTHTGEYMYKCSNCKRCVNNKQALAPHFENVCPNGEIIVRQQLSKDLTVVEAFVCNLCNYVQMVEENVIKHLKEQHNILNSFANQFNSIILINIHNIPLLGNEEQQQQAALADTIPKTNMDFIDPNQTTDNDKLDPFVAKEQNDLSLDKNFMNYMNDMSFSTAESSSQILGKSSSIIDQLSERLQSGNKGDVISSDTKPKTSINRRYSIAEQLSNRFNNVTQQQNYVSSQHENIQLIQQHPIENNDDGAESPIPVVYILDNLDDDIDNVELAESSEQLIVPVDKPISTARANQLNEMMSDTNRNNDNSDKNNSTNSSSIIARLNERFKSPQKKQIKAKEVLQEKASVSRPGTMIIDRLNRRLNSIDDREKPDNLQKTQNSESFMTKKQLLSDELPSISSKEKTQNESDDLFDTSDNKLVIDEESCNEEDILNEETGILEPAKKLTKKNIPDVNSELRLSNDSDLEILDNEECTAADDDDWEDIEIMTENDFDNDPKLSSIPSSSSTITDKPNNLYQTISRLYAASIKPKNKLALKNRKPLLKNKLTVVDKKCSSKKSKLTDNNDSPVPYPLPDFVTDAIPSPVSNELTVDPPVPLPSEPLSDLNDISAILEPSASTDIGSNINNITTPNLGSPIDLCNIDDDDIFILNDETNIEHALALAAEIEKTGNDLQNEIELDRSTFIVNNSNKMATVTTTASTITSIVSDHNINLNKNERVDSLVAEHSKTKKYRIDKLGFSITNGKIKYLCLVDSCSFLYSELDIGLQNHYHVDHPNLTWDGFCYTCESLVCFDDDNLPLFRELKHMNEVHITNLKKNNNLTTNITTTATSSSMLMPEKPKISLRRLSGDMLSIKPTSIDLNEDDLIPNSTEITTKTLSSSTTNPISIQSLNFIKSTDLNLSYANNKPISSSVVQMPVNNTSVVKTIQIPQNMFIKKLLNTPSVPPPIPPNLSRLNEETGILESVTNYSKINISTNSENMRTIQPVQQNCVKNPIILNNKLASRSKDIQFKLKIKNINDISSSTIGNSSTGNTNSLLRKCYKAANATQSVTARCTPQQQIKNNAFGGSNLLISSVAEGVRLPNTTQTNQISTADNESTSLLKIQSVCSLNSNKTSLQTPTSIPTTTVNDKISAPQPIKSPIITTTKPPVITHQTPLTATIISTDSNSVNINASNVKVVNRIQPWLQPYSNADGVKSYSIVQLQLRAISLYALYKCMNATCFFTTNCSDKLKKHFICHEFSGATTNKSALLQSNINYRDWLNCAYCKYHGDTSENLLDHIKEIHLTDIYQCPYCFYRSCCECNVQEHQHNYHLGKKPLIYVTFGDRKKLALEIRFLARNRAKYIMPIPCNDCPKKFYLLRNYITHVREQHNVNSDNYTCGICKIEFQKRGASFHLSSSHNISIYQCIYCNVSTSIRSRMILHMTDQHPSNLLYSCVRVSPNKDMDIPEETIENSTVLANLSEPVDPSILVECNFTLEQLNFMSPSLDAKSIQDNRSGTIILTTNQPIDINKSTSKTPSPPQQQNQSKNIKIIAVESLSNNNSTANSRSTIISPAPINTSAVNISKTTHELLKSPSTIKISAILQNCPKFLTNQSILKSALTTSSSSTKSTDVISSSTKSTDVIITNLINPTEEITNKSPQLIENTIEKNNESINSSSCAMPSSTAVVDKCNNNNLNDRIIKAGKELVQDTGYEGYDLYRCAYPECINIKITETTLFDHIQLKHSRNRSFKCPHCTSQYQSAKTLRHHLNTHRMHKFFCYFCNYTTITQQIITKHINDSHSKNAFIKTVPLALPSNSNIINNNNSLQQNYNQDDIFYVTCPSNTTPNEILQYGERLIRICDRKKSLTKKSFKPDEIDQLPMQSIFHHEVICSQCNYKTKVRTNMYRHLLYHTKEVVVPSIDPVNPVPCLNTNEKHYDRMINLACSSNINKDTTQNNSNDLTITTKSDNSLLTKSTTNNNSNNTKLELKIPIFIPSMKRYVCSVNGCNYLTINDSMLKHHLNTLHLTEKSYKCLHCKVECCVRKQLCTDKIIQHLKFHDSKIFVCNECSYIHYQKHLVERHIYEKHPNKTIDLIRYERTDTDTIINHQLYSGTQGGGGSTSTPSSSINNILLNTDKIVNNNSNNVDDDMTWECTICKHKSINAMEMHKHVLHSHNIRFRYACLHCKFGAGQFKTVMEHITDKHPTKDRKVKCAFNRVDETPVVTEDFLQQDNRPLWSRADPHRVKHIRGILMEEEEVEDNANNINPMNSIDEIPTISNNNLQEKILKKSKTSLTKSRPTRNDSEKNETINTEKNNKNSSVTEINETTTNSSTNKITETSAESAVVVETNITEYDNHIDIYECSYCPIKNISFKSIYTHWLFHHCDKQNKNPLLSKPFSFKLWGFMSKENSTEFRLQEIKENDLIRLQRLGQRATRFQCNECWRLFANSSSVILHQENEHKNSIASRCLQYKNITFYICNFCGYASSMECKTAAHLFNHYGGFKKCHLCNLKFDKFLEFVSHLAMHQVTFKDFIENDSEIIIFWNQIKILYPNGLCIQRGFLPKKLNNNLLQQLVVKQIENAVKSYRKSQKSIESNDHNSITEQEKEKESITTNKIVTNEQVQNNLDNVIASTSAVSETENLNLRNTIKSILTNEQITENQTKFNNIDNVITSTSPNSETDSVSSTNTVKSTVINDHKISKTKIKKRTKKRTKDNEEWMPPTMKKRKIQSETDGETDDDSDDDDEGEDYLIPLKYLMNDVMPLNEQQSTSTSIIPTNTDSNDSIIVVPKRKPGPKCMQQKPYSFYGLPPKNDDLKSLFTTMQIGNDEKPVVVSCENFARFVNIKPIVHVTKLDLNTIQENKPVKTYKRKLSHLINNIIDEQLRVKQFKETK